MAKKAYGSTESARVIRTIHVEDDVLNRSLADVISDPIPFPRFEKVDEDKGENEGTVEEAAGRQHASANKLESSLAQEVAKLQQDVIRLQQTVALQRTNKPEQPEIDYREPNYTTQQQINHGQRRINGQLCLVDLMLVETLKLLRLEIAKIPGLAKADFQKIDQLLKSAYHGSAAVPLLKPPGCEPALEDDPNWTVLDTIA